MRNNLIGISGKIGAGKDLIYHIINYLHQEKDWRDFDHYMSDAFFVHTVFENKKFAGKLKDIACLLLGCTREQLEDREFKEKELGEEWWYHLVSYTDADGIDAGQKLVPYGQKIEKELGYNHTQKLIKLTPRKLLQLLGTEAGREILHPNIWVNALFADYKSGYVEQGVGWVETENDYPNWIITDVRFPNEVKVIEDRGGVVIRVNRDYKNPLMPDVAIPEHPSETALDDHDFKHVIENDGSIEELVKKVKQLNLV